MNRMSVIGKNCNLSPGVTLGETFRGTRRGTSRFGDDVYVGPGAKIIGRVTIGNNLAIGVNCVVTRDAPDNSVVAGVPGRIVSQDGSAGYVVRTEYDEDDGKFP